MIVYDELSVMAQQLSTVEGQYKNTTALLKQAERDREEAAGQTVNYSEELGLARNRVDVMNEQLSRWIWQWYRYYDAFYVPL